MLDMTYEEYMGEAFQMFFNGLDLSDHFYVVDVTGRSLSPNEIQTLTVSGMPGSYLVGKRKPGVPLKVKALLVKGTAQDLRNAIDQLNDILDTEEEASIRFSDEEDKAYYGILSDISEGYEVDGTHLVTITFHRSDPYKYGPEIEASFPSDYVNIKNNGTAAAKPIFELEVLQDTTFAMIQNQLEEYMLLGSPTQVDTPTYQKYERVFYSDCDTLTGWTDANAGEVKGVIDGQMAVQGSTRFQPSNYGEETAGVWHGPAIKTSLPETLQDFRIQSWISMYNKFNPNLLGKVEIYLLDVNGNIITRMGMMDGSARTANMYGLAMTYSGENYDRFIYEYGDKMGNWNDFAGVLRIQRIGNNWYAYIAKTDTQTGRHYTRRSVFWTDYENTYNLRVAQVAVYISQYGSYDTPNALGVYSISVDKINQPTSDEEADIAFKAGDIITFDHDKKVLLVNGEPRNDLKDFGASFFRLYKGNNPLTVMPFETFNVKARYREPFK